MKRAGEKVSLRRSALDKVAEVLKFDRQVNIVHRHFFRNLENDRGEIKNSRNASADEGVGHFLSGRGGNGEDGHPHPRLMDKFRQFLHRVNRLSHCFVVTPGGVEIEGGDNLKSLLLESTIG